MPLKKPHPRAAENFNQGIVPNPANCVKRSDVTNSGDKFCPAFACACVISERSRLVGKTIFLTVWAGGPDTQIYRIAQRGGVVGRDGFFHSSYCPRSFQPRS